VRLAVIALADVHPLPIPAVAKLLDGNVAVFMIPLAPGLNGVFPVGAVFRQVCGTYRPLRRHTASVRNCCPIGAYWF